MRKNELLIRVIVGALAVSVLSVVPEDLGAQLANASASTIALSGNNIATVTGFGRSASILLAWPCPAPGSAWRSCPFRCGPVSGPSG